MRLTFVHAADLHLDSPMRSLAAAEPLAGVLRGATFVALERIVSLCVERKAELLVLSGDLFDAKDRSVKARLALRAAVDRLHQGGVRTFIVHGNHDPLTEDVRALALPPSAHVFGAKWEEVQVRRGDAVLCRVQGISYAQEKMTSDLSHHFRRVGPELTIGALHCNLSAFPGHANYAPCTPTDLGERGLDYWALGHLHNHGETELPGGGVAVYPGNPQGRHPQEAGPKGCVVVEVEGTRTRRTFVPLDPVRWHEVPVDIGPIATIEALEDQVVAQVTAACEAASAAEERAFQAHAVRVALEGAGTLHSVVAAPDALAELERHFREALAGRSIALEWLVERTRPALDLRAIRRRGGLSAEVLLADGNPWPAELRALDLQLQRAGLPKLSSDTARAAAVLETARQRALELLEEGPTS